MHIDPGILCPGARTALGARLRPRVFRRGQTVFNDGDRADCLYIVVTGRVEVQVSTHHGQMITLRVVQPGEWFGELALVHPDHRRLGRVCALEDTCTRVLARRDYEELREIHPCIDRLLLQFLAAQVVRASALALELLMSPESRIWRRLDELSREYGDDPIRMSQDALAHTAGTVRQTVNRVLRSGVREGVLQVRRNEIRVVDRVALTAHGAYRTL